MAGGTPEKREEDGGQGNKFGVWMVAQRPRKGRKPAKKESRTEGGQKKGQKNVGNVVLSSRFDVLGAEVDIEEGVAVQNRRPLKDISNLRDKAGETREDARG